ncbi:MAG: hypothetical protein ACP5IL_12935 [Syntrophobacteraceae bacterium]
MAFAPAISAGIAAVSAAAGIAGTVMQGEASAQSANYQAAVASNNQKIAQQNQQMALEQGAIAQEQAKEKEGAQIAQERAAYGAMGVDPNSGSPLSVRESTSELGQLNANTIKYNSHVQAWNDVNQAGAYGAQSSLYGSQAGWDTAGSVIGGIGNVSSKWLSWQTMAGGGGSSAGAAGNPLGSSYNDYYALNSSGGAA